ncbi:MAG: hypothetical protein CMK06_01460 [Ponticaulis sp.]|nr:hypothetical protein [Ponticaulis sp.]
MEQQLSDLFARLAHGDRDALRGIYRGTAPKLYGVAQQLIGDPAIARQVLKSVYSDLWNHKGLPFSVNGLNLMDCLIAITKRKALSLEWNGAERNNRITGELTKNPKVRSVIESASRDSRLNEEEWYLVACLLLDRETPQTLSSRLEQSPEVIEARVHNIVRKYLGREAT